MHSAPHRNNSDFQLRHFIAGSCHTADAAWNLLYEQKLDIKLKLANTKSQMLKRQAYKIDLEKRKNSVLTEQDHLRYEADMIEFEASEGLLELALEGVTKELQTIESLMAELEPYRKYKDMPFLEATEAAQQDEWREEFKHRAENYLMSQGVIPHDQLEAMRKHPDFVDGILPHISKTMAALENANSNSKAVLMLTRTSLLLEGGKNGTT